MKILFLGDVFGQPGRDAVVRELPGLVDELAVGFVIANGENVANGAGITSKLAQKLLGAGVDVITTGNHVWRQREVFPFLDSSDRIVRPANFPPSSPGRGLTVQTAASGDEVAVINLMGQVFMGTAISPFRIVDALVDEAQTLAETIVVDVHAEATSEKVAMAQYLDGRVTAVVGTHTHVQTADEHVSARGTAAITDVGMCGPFDIGHRRAQRDHSAALSHRAAGPVRGGRRRRAHRRPGRDRRGRSGHRGRATGATLLRRGRAGERRAGGIRWVERSSDGRDSPMSTYGGRGCPRGCAGTRNGHVWSAPRERSLGPAGPRLSRLEERDS